MSGPSVRQALTTSTRATALLATVLLTSCQHTSVTTAPSPTSATTAYVVDGDTFAITTHDANEATHVRILGIDTPETDECGSEEATHALRQLLPQGTQITLTYDQHTATQDKYGRTLAYVATPTTTDVGLKLITNGYAAAWWPHHASTPQRANHYAAAQNAARTTQTGSWKHCTQIGRHKAQHRTP